MQSHENKKFARRYDRELKQNALALMQQRCCYLADDIAGTKCPNFYAGFRAHEVTVLMLLCFDDDWVDAACIIVSSFSGVYPSRRDADGSESRLKRRARSTNLHKADADKRPSD
jgi:hypothetical protein